jgi:formylglycine-generating enzyme required for sulfatase activity
MEPGVAFGPWLLDKQLGVGGMGEVWLATHRVLATQIAVKILAPELTRDPRFRERFISEAKVQARLSHPHIAHVQDFLEEGGRFAILMELIPGGTVADAIDRARGPLPIEQTLKWAKQALDALDYAHQHGVIHRDVKPANLMLDGAGNVKVTDFGIAIALGAGRMTTTGRSIGTPQYMSPEQIMRPQSVDHRTDVYSMGIVLYEMLAGRVPFDADADYMLQRLHIEAPPPSLRSLNPLVPEWLESVVLQCLAKSPGDRFAGCASLAAALRERASPTVPTAAPDRRIADQSFGLAAGEMRAHAPTEFAEPRAHPAPSGPWKRGLALAAPGLAAIALMLVQRGGTHDYRYDVSEFASAPSTAPAAASALTVVGEEPIAAQPAPARTPSWFEANDTERAAPPLKTQPQRAVVGMVTKKDLDDIGKYGGRLTAARKASPKDVLDLLLDSAPPLTPGTTMVNPKDGLTYVWIPPGRFTMGCSPGDSECYDAEKPAHEVTITRGFWLGQTPVTQQAYQRVTGQNPSHFKGAGLPVETVNWNEAKSYCEAIGGRLPTEGEWEYAARAGSTAARYGNPDEIAWYLENSGGTTHEVGKKRANAFGLYDTLGSVWQWVADWYGNYVYGAQSDPSGAGSGQTRALRGGSFYNNVRDARVSLRGRNDPGLRNVNFGLRCVGE